MLSNLVNPSTMIELYFVNLKCGCFYSVNLFIGLRLSFEKFPVENFNRLLQFFNFIVSKTSRTKLFIEKILLLWEIYGVNVYFYRQLVDKDKNMSIR